MLPFTKTKSMKVSLFVTCLMDWLAPEVAESIVRLLTRLGVEVDFPDGQTCCGQPLFNCGFRREAARVGQHLVSVFAGSEAVVVPSGSCAAMIRHHIPEVLSGKWQAEARALGERTYEFSQFLTEVLGVEDVGARFEAKVTYHDSCHLLRDLGVHDGPRRLLRHVDGLELVELPDADVCCGFGGAFSVRMAPVSNGILTEKVRQVGGTGADYLVASDLSCLLHMRRAAGEVGVKAIHLAEVLAGSS